MATLVLYFRETKEAYRQKLSAYVEQEEARLDKEQEAIRERHRALVEAVQRKEQEQVRPKRLVLPPGWRLGTIARFVLTKRTYQLVIEPQLSDHQLEYVEASAAADKAKARWIRVRCSLVLIQSMALQMPISLARACWDLWKSASR